MFHPGERRACGACSPASRRDSPNREAGLAVTTATRTETSVVYAAGAVQGIVLVTFPAASPIFTDPDQYGLSNTQYGLRFLPQVATAITASLLGAWFARGFGTKRVYLTGLTSGLVSISSSSSAGTSSRTPPPRFRCCSSRQPFSVWASASPFRR